LVVIRAATVRKIGWGKKKMIRVGKKREGRKSFVTKTQLGGRRLGAVGITRVDKQKGKKKHGPFATGDGTEHYKARRYKTRVAMKKASATNPPSNPHQDKRQERNLKGQPLVAR